MPGFRQESASIRRCSASQAFCLGRALQLLIAWKSRSGELSDSSHEVMWELCHHFGTQWTGRAHAGLQGRKGFHCHAIRSAMLPPAHTRHGPQAITYLQEIVPPLLLLGLAVFLLALRALRLLGSLLPLGRRLLLTLCSPSLPLLCPAQRTTSSGDSSCNKHCKNSCP